MARVIDGAAIARTIRAELAQQIAAQKIARGLAVLLIGDNPASQIYVRNKARAATEVGIESRHYALPAATTQDEVLALIDDLNRDITVHGILVQLPLPPQIEPQTVIAAIAPEKDVDGFHPVNVGRLGLGLPCLVPCTPQGCMILLREALPDLAGRRAIILGRSAIVGKPTAQLLLQADCTVTIAHSRSRDVADECRRADIVIAAIGKAEYVKGDWIKEGAVVIDVGINRIDDAGKTRIVGDVDFATASPRAAAITPVPGGVGPMTIACLLRNVVKGPGLILN